MDKYRSVFFAILVVVARADTSEKEGKKLIDEINQKSAVLAQDLVAKRWAANTADKESEQNANKEVDEAKKKWDAYQKEFYPKIISFPWKTFQDQRTKYMFQILSFTQKNVLPDDKTTKYNKLIQDIYDVGDITKILLKEYNSADNIAKLTLKDVGRKANKNFKNVDEMNFYWKECHDNIGKPVKNLFTQLIALENENAHMKEYTDAAALWQDQYDINNFEKKMLELYKQIQPLFQELHAYIRYKLWVATGKNDKIVDPNGPIPASLLGYNWGQNVAALYEVLEPYPSKPSMEWRVSSQLKAKGYTGQKMAKTAEEFYVSLGLSEMPKDFWDHSIFEKKEDLSCSPSIFDFVNGKDYRVVFCAEPKTYDFAAMHTYVGITEYNMASQNLPYYFKKLPNTPLNIAFESTIHAFAVSPDYLKSLDLLDSNEQLDNEQVINNLLAESLDQVFFLPWAYTVDQWRWKVVKGKITPQHYNCEYWNSRIDFQGVKPPVKRDENDFDIGLRSWFVAGGQYSTYYIAKFLTYEMITELCKTAGYYDPTTKPNNNLVFCDVHNSKAVGTKLKEMMAIGNSLPWYDAMAKVTGKKKLDASGLLEYYKPLYKWLQEENKKNQVTVGWNAPHKVCH